MTDFGPHYIDIQLEKEIIVKAITQMVNEVALNRMLYSKIAIAATPY